MDISKLNLDKDTKEFLTLITQLKKSDKEKYVEVKGLVKGILISSSGYERQNLKIWCQIWNKIK